MSQMKLGNVQISYDALEESWLKPSECRQWVEGSWPNPCITFIVAKKA